MSEKLIRERNKLLLSVILFLILLIVEKTGILPFLPEHSLWYLPLYLIPYFLSGLSVVKECFLGIKNRRPFDEALLMTVATLGAFLSGEFAEAVAVMVFYQMGELFQSYAVGKSRKSIKELMDIVPELAHIEREDGTVDTVDPDEVEVGDMLLVKPGERVPVDGIVRQGESMVNTAALTGESVPREVYPDRSIFGIGIGYTAKPWPVLGNKNRLGVSGVFRSPSSPYLVISCLYLFSSVLSLRLGDFRAPVLLRRNRCGFPRGCTGKGLQLSGAGIQIKGCSVR